jgi:hypothetical protein
MLKTHFGPFATADHPISGVPAILSEQRRGLDAWENVCDSDLRGLARSGQFSLVSQGAAQAGFRPSTPDR